MAQSELLTQVKNALGITGNFQDDTLLVYIEEVQGFMSAAGVDDETINSAAAAGCIARGVADLWNYGAGNAKLSSYFTQRMLQLAAKQSASVASAGGENDGN